MKTSPIPVRTTFKLNRHGCIPKLCGADVELGNFLLGVESADDSAGQAARLLLRQVSGYPVERQSQGWFSGFNAYGGAGLNPMDWGRRFLKENGGCIYIDLDHLELCLPEVLSARDHVAAWRAMLRLARQALLAANADLPQGRKILALANNSDGRHHSYGSHVNLLVRRQTWDNIFNHRLHYLLYLAAFQASSIVLTGAGKVGSENGSPAVPYQISQRADFIEVLTGPQTTYKRPMVNSRDEALCGFAWSGPNQEQVADELARLHVIFYDSTLAQTACFLKIGTLQIMAAMLEAGRIDPNLFLDEPVAATKIWSHDPDLKAKARTVGRQKFTATELQLRFAEEASRFVDAGGCDQVVPDAAEIVRLWIDTLQRLQALDFQTLSRRLDWVLKRSILERACQQHGLRWDAPQLKQLDLLYSDLENGLFWPHEQANAVDRVVPDEAIEHFLHEPPENTRAWGRAALLRLARPSEVEQVDWDSIQFRLPSRDHWPVYRTLDLDNPLGCTRAHWTAAFQPGSALEEVVERLATPPGREESGFAGTGKLLPAPSSASVGGNGHEEAAL